MIDKKYFKKLENEFDELESKREKLIKNTRDVIKRSKAIIYSVHRNEMKNAEKELKTIKSEVKELQKVVSKYPKLDIGAYKVALQEYVEAICYYSIATGKPLPTHDELDIDFENFLLGCCDLSGELVRRGINEGINLNTEEVKRIKKVVDDLYDVLQQFNFRNSDLRRKFDGIKYDVKKVDQVLFDLTLKNE